LDTAEKGFRKMKIARELSIRAVACAALFGSLFLLADCSSKSPEQESKGAPVAGQPAPPANPCVLPTAMASSNEQTAWQIFVAANCVTSGGLTWSTWTEQTCFVNPSSCAGQKATGHRLHASLLQERRRLRTAPLAVAPLPPCQSMTTKTTPQLPADMLPFVPANLAKNPRFCEEVFVDPSEASFVTAPSSGNSLTTLTAQVAYTASAPGGAITFPTPGVEIKADWLPADSITPSFNCTDNAPAGVYTEVIEGKCYALVGMHFTSKLLPNWLWATFEPQNTMTNPNRCNPGLYNSCNDPWGSAPATSTGAMTNQTADLKALMVAAKLPPAFSNYRLVAAQSVYVDGSGQAIQLGNSFTEFNAQVDVHQASCITCHSYAMAATSQPPKENPNFGAFPGDPGIGNPGQPPALPSGQKWVSQDFSWMLGIMPASAKK
jgi:hypothetical protein